MPVTCEQCGAPVKPGSRFCSARCANIRPIAHGTPAGYKRHRRAGEAACEECRKAWAVTQRKSRYRAKPGRVLVPVELLVELMATAEPGPFLRAKELLPYLGGDE